MHAYLDKCLKTRLPVYRFNHPWTDDLHYVVMNTVRLLMCVYMLLRNTNQFFTSVVYTHRYSRSMI